MKLRVWLTLTTATAGLLVFGMAWFFVGYYRDHVRQEVLIQSTLAYMQTSGRTECEANAASWMPEPAKGARGQDAVRGRRPPMRRQLFAYDSRLISANPDAPAVDDSLRGPNAKGEIADRRWVGKPLLKHPGPGGPGRGPGRGPSGLDDIRPDEIRVGGMREHGGPAGQETLPDDLRLGEILIPMPWHTGPCANILVRFEEPPAHAGPDGFTPPTEIWVVPVLVMVLTVLAAASPVVRRIRRLTRQVGESAKNRYGTPIAIGGHDEIGQLSAAFETAREEILAQVAQQEERERNLRAFVENTTHDVSIPLTVLQGHLTEMARAAETGAACDGELVAAAVTEAQYMTALLGNLAVASRLESGEPTMQQIPVDMNELVRRCVSRHRPIARQLGVSLEHAIPEKSVVATGDMTFIEQAVNNVIFNAIRHNRRDGHVAVILEQAGDVTASLSIIDDGPGIPDQEMARLTERYYRGGKERGRGADNQGIGLNIASRIADMHGWKFGLSRSEFGGLKVCFEFAANGLQIGPAESSGDNPQP